ncbi:hypothetical protein ONR57_01500 [Hoyosella sp. YIM 151337]|uniref:hypothetical protein n=1 Tax=Hoyosella sp. YIM 151337 TaxID=2992742 RepID=UPI0022363C74|nr:hypothetical protein [Hoyosella sp. YIM 151337]MCW4351974.1 hypothetical protein [Hoyosella sp. YIM 151337]
MHAELTLSDLTALSGLDVLDHLDREVTVPVTSGLQAQGDLIVIPYAVVSAAIQPAPWARSIAVPRSGIELLRSAAGGNPHCLVADEGTCIWTTSVQDTMRLALGIIETTGIAYLLHPEHGATGIAPGCYVVRRQRERGAGRLGPPLLVAD